MNRNECGSSREGTWEIESKYGGGEGNVRDLGSRTIGRFGLCKMDACGRDVCKCMCESVCVGGCECMPGESRWDSVRWDK